MKTRKLLPISAVMLSGAVVLLALLVAPPAQAQPGDGFILAGVAIPARVLAQPSPVPVAGPTPTPADPAAPNPAEQPVSADNEGPKVPDDAASQPKEDEVTPEAMADQFNKVVSDWRTVGWLAGLAALIALLIMVLKYKPIDALFERLEKKWVKPLIAAILGGISAGILAYIADGDVVTAIVAGLTVIGPAAVGIFEIFSKVKARNRDGGNA